MISKEFVFQREVANGPQLVFIQPPCLRQERQVANFLVRNFLALRFSENPFATRLDDFCVTQAERAILNGDLTKLRHVTTLSDDARRLVRNVEHTTRRIAGTHEVRRSMRFLLHSYRVVFGVPVFITFSPAEKDCLLMVRMSRTLAADPVRLGDRTAPPQSADPGRGAAWGSEGRCEIKKV